MLYSFDSNSFVKKMPHINEFEAWKKRLSTNEYDTIVVELNNRIDSDEIHTAGWIPGSDWTGTVFEPIYIACGKNVEISGMFFGLIVFNLMMERKDCWGFGKYEKNGIPIQSMTYFKTQQP